ncbi:MAG: chromosomal replication initiator DnaA [Pacificimonas sp.]
MTGQLGLPLSAQSQAGGDERLFLSEANHKAAVRLEQCKSWPEAAAALVGPPGSGKSRLARHAAAASAGQLHVLESLSPAELDEPALFHNLVRAATDRSPLLLVTETPPTSWSVELPDLRSRLAVLPIIPIEAPDETLIAELLGQEFVARGLSVKPDVLSYAAQRLERRYDAVQRLAARIDRAALVEKRNVSIPFVRRLLADTSETETEAT